MRSTMNFIPKTLSLAAMLFGAATLAACGGGGAAGTTSRLVIDGVVPAPASEPAETPVDTGDPAPIVPVVPIPPEDPPVEPPAEEPPTVEPDLGPQPDLARVSAMALVPENADRLELPEEYAGLYLGDDDGVIWRQTPAGHWRRLGASTLDVPIEAMTYVPSKHALYLAQDTRSHGYRLARFQLAADAVPQFEILSRTLGAGEELEFPVTGLAFDTVEGRLYGMGPWIGGTLVRFPDLDQADQVLVAALNLQDEYDVSGVSDLAFDARTGRMLVLNGWNGNVVELDHLGLAVNGVEILSETIWDLRALAVEDGGDRLAVDRGAAAIVRFDEFGNVIH